MISTSRIYDIYERLPRPSLRWVALGGSAWACGLCDIAGFPLETSARVAIFTFAAAVYGLRGWEKMRGNPAPAPVVSGEVFE